MTKIKIDTGALSSSVDKSLSEIKTNLKSIKIDASSLNTSLSFNGSDKIANIATKIGDCITSIGATIEWYENCCYNYNQFSQDSVNDIGSLEVDEFKNKEFEIKK